MDATRGAVMDSPRGMMDAGRGGGVMVDPRVETGRLDQNYMMVRAQSRLQDGYDRLSHRDGLGPQCQLGYKPTQQLQFLVRTVLDIWYGRSAD
jgi:hypothetical protein